MKKYLPYIPGILVLIFVTVLSIGRTYMVNGFGTRDIDEGLSRIELNSPQQQDIISYQLDSNSVQSVLWYYLHTVRGN